MSHKRSREQYSSGNNNHYSDSHTKSQRTGQNTHSRQSNGKHSISNGSSNYTMNNGNSRHSHNTHTHHSNDNRKSNRSHDNPNHTPMSKTKLLNSKYPPQTQQPSIPSYNKTGPLKIHLSLPPLPDIEPGPLQDAPFTHASIADARTDTQAGHRLSYERLEFLGDAYLEAMATRLIYSHFPALPVGRQVQLRERLIRNTTLAGFARKYGFGDRVMKTGAEMPKDKYEKMLADCFEAYVAAVVLSWAGDKEKEKEHGNGFARAETWLTELWCDILLEFDPEVVANRKDELVRLVGGKSAKLEYIEEKVTAQEERKALGDKDAKGMKGQVFKIVVVVTGWGYEGVKLGSGIGLGKKEAGMRAAMDALENNAELVEEISRKKAVEMERIKAEIARRDAVAGKDGD